MSHLKPTIQAYKDLALMLLPVKVGFIFEVSDGNFTY